MATQHDFRFRLACLSSSNGHIIFTVGQLPHSTSLASLAAEAKATWACCHSHQCPLSAEQMVTERGSFFWVPLIVFSFW